MINMKMYEDYLCELAPGELPAGVTNGRLLTFGLLSGPMLIWRAKRLVDNVFSKEARQCSTIVSPKEKTICITRIKLSNLNLEMKQLKSSIYKCKDAKCKQQIAEKIRKKTEQYHDKTEQYNKLMG